MDQETLSLLDFDAVLGLIEELAQSALGRAGVREIEPLEDRQRLDQRLKLVEECVRYRSREGRPGLHDLEDPRPLLAQLGLKGRMLDLEQLAFALAILKLAARTRRALTAARWPVLGALVSEMTDPAALIRELERVIDPAGNLREDASPELQRVRRRQAKARRRANQQLEGCLRGGRAAALIPDPYITVRNERYVIPVREDRQKQIPGVIHGTSSSGATLFVEPFTVVDLNNQILRALEEEQEIVHRLLARLTDLLRRRLQDVVRMVETLGQLDLLFAAAEFAARHDCVVPDLNPENRLEIDGARHPLLEKDLGRAGVVPISAALGGEERVLIISGPNTGGKTVALKTIGLFCVMGQSGLPVPAGRAELPMLAQVLADLGDHQSIAAHLSSFSAHIQRLRRMMLEQSAPMLVLLDEVGRATDPDHGAALAVAVVDYFRERGNLVVATTHHPAVKAFAFSTRGVRNASVQLDPVTLAPAYRLEFGLAGDSSGLEIAGQLGLDPGLIQRARSLLADRTVQIEDYLARLRAELDALKERQLELERERQRVGEAEQDLERRFQRRQGELEEQWQRRLEELAADFRRWARSLKDRFEAARVRKESKRREELLKESFRRRMQDEGRPPGGAEAAIEAGDWVHHAVFNQQGRVLEVEQGEAVVEISGKRVNSALGLLRKAERASRRAPRNVTLEVIEDEVRELNVAGLTVEEALEKADKFLDRAFVSGLREVKLVHGLGTGRLKSALSEFLATHPHVDAYTAQGGSTLVALGD